MQYLNIRAQNMEEKSKRRTNLQLEQDMMNAIEHIVVEKGFSDIPIMEFINRAHIDPNVFYRRYKTLDDIYSTLARRYDFWINDSIDVSDIQKLGDRAFLANVIKQLHKNLLSNPIMQKLLLWELTEVNETTKHSSQFRDTMNASLVLYYKRIFDKINIDAATIVALLVGGTYYLTLHRGIATFCLIDFDSEQGRKKLDAAIDSITELLFLQIEQHNRQITMAKEMDKDGIKHKDICRYMGITTKELNKLLE